MPHTVPRCACQKPAGDTVDNQSTTWPMMANSAASYTASSAEVSVSNPIQPRMPRVQAQTKAKKPGGGGTGSVLGYGGTRFSKNEKSTD